MRRIASIIFLVAGGWLLMVEPMMAFIDMRLGSWLGLVVMLIFLVVAGVPLGIGTALSPGNRRRELGLTILITLGVGVVCAVSMAAILLDPGFKQFEPLMPPMPDFRLAPLPGLLNLAVVAAAGWWLYRTRVERRAEI
jgi:cation transport ATPase